MSCGGLSCRELCDFLCEYLEGEMPQDRKARFEEHVNACPPCGEYLATYRRTILAAKACHGCGCKEAAIVKAPPPPADMIDAVMKTLRAEGVCKKQSQRL